MRAPAEEARIIRLRTQRVVGRNFHRDTVFMANFPGYGNKRFSADLELYCIIKTTKIIKNNLNDMKICLHQITHQTGVHRPDN
jgi:hypothetical protein